MNNLNPDEFTSFQIPDNFLEKLYEFTGATEEASKGFIICYADQTGTPMILTRAGTPITEMGLRKALEKYLMQIEEADLSMGSNEDIEN